MTTLPAHKRTLARHTNPRLLTGDLAVAVRDAHVFIGLSWPDILTRAHVETMAPDPIVFALANPAPEIEPHTIADLAAVTATGRSDYPNQVNNVLAFPGLFRGALDAHATASTPAMLLAAAHALADLVPYPRPDMILPDPVDPAVVPAVATAVRHAARP